MKLKNKDKILIKKSYIIKVVGSKEGTYIKSLDLILKILIKKLFDYKFLLLQMPFHHFLNIWTN